MENKKDKKVALNDELLDAVSGGSDEGSGDSQEQLICTCGGPLISGACINALCPNSNLYTPVYESVIDSAGNIFRDLPHL